MFLECRLDEETTVYIDAEPAGGVSKDQMAVSFHPDRALDHVVELASVIARKLSLAAAETSMSIPTPAEIELGFGIRVDADAIVSLARTIDTAQFTVQVRWRPAPP